MTEVQINQTGGLSVQNDTHGFQMKYTTTNPHKEVTVIESKKCRTDENLDDPIGLNTEVMMDSKEDEHNSKEQLGPNNNLIPKT